MNSLTVARRYATALAEVAIARNEAREVQEELIAWQHMIESNAELQEVFRNPTIPLDQKRGVLKKLLDRAKARETTANFLRLLLRNQRINELAEINSRFAQVLDERAGVVATTVTTARPVPEMSQRELHEKLSALTRKNVRLTFETDPDLIGGLVARIGSTVYDGSVRSQLEQIKEKLAG